MSETQDTAETVEISEGLMIDQNEAQFMDQVEGMFAESDEKPEPKEEPVAEEPEPDEDPEVEEDDGEEDPEPDDEEEDDEPTDKISIRINGKKADVNDLLEKTAHTVKVDGEEIEVDYTDLVKGYQRGNDYAKKTTELKQQREEMQPFVQMVAHAKQDPQFVQYVQSYFENGPYIEAAHNPDLKVNDQQLAAMLDKGSPDYDPDHASRIMAARQEWTATAQERQQIQQQVNAEMMQTRQAWAQEQIGLAQTAINERGGEGAYEKHSQEVVDYLAGVGFNEQEISSLIDHRMAIVAFDAAVGRKERENAPKARLGSKRKQKLPPRSADANQGKRGSSKRKRARDTNRRAISTQNPDDWVSAIESRLKL